MNTERQHCARVLLHRRCCSWQGETLQTHWLGAKTWYARFGGTNSPGVETPQEHVQNLKQNICAALLVRRVACPRQRPWLEAGDCGSVQPAPKMFRSFFAPRSVSSTTPAAAGDVASPKEKDGVASKRSEVAASPETQRKDQAVANHIQKMDTKIR